MVVAIERLDPSQVAEAAGRALGLEASGADLFSPEGLSAELRRAASFLCPATPGDLIRAAVEVLSGLPGYSAETPAQLQACVDALVSYGDLLELRTSDGASRRLFLGPPSFVRRSSGTCLIIGIRPEGAPIVGEDLGLLVDYEAHTRALHPALDLDPEQALLESGLTPVSADQWLNFPRPVGSEELIHSYSIRLDAAGPAGQIEDYRVIDPHASVTYYRGRWRNLRRNDEGLFVGRRPQAYGAPLWCFARVANGSVLTLIDLPVVDPFSPGADEAWRLQAALDHQAGHPQRLRIRSAAQPDQVVLDFFSPLPSWAQRRLDVVATPLLRGQGALLSYAIPRHELEEERRFLAEMLWLSEEIPMEERGSA